jgi:hypothetical protein
MKWYRFFKSSDDGKTVTLSPTCTGGFVFPNVSFTTDTSVTTKTIASAKTLSATGTYVPIQCYLSVASDAVDSTIGTSYFKVVTAAAMSGQIANVMVRTTLSHNVFDAYGLQTHLVFGTSKTVATTDANAHLTALSAKVTFDTSTVSKGWVTAGLFIIEGAGTCSQMCHGVSIVEEAGSTGAQSMLHLNTDVGTTPYFSFAGADASGKSLYTHAVTMGATGAGSIKILVNGVARYIPFVAGE